jgi:hypothetical protein
MGSAKSIRIEPAFDEPELVKALFNQHAPYRTMAGYLPIASLEETCLPWFRGNWAINGEPLVAGAEKILHNRRFIDAARQFFDGEAVRPTFIVANVNTPMPPGAIHIDVPSFRGVTRDHCPLAVLVAMGQSGLFERWRVIQAGAVSWFYEGAGGNFEYWPEGPEAPMVTERPPFRNVAVMADNDRIYHRIGRVGASGVESPRISSAAEIRRTNEGWEIVENGETRATYQPGAIRLSLVWKAVRESEARAESLSLDRMMSIFIDDLRRRKVDFRVPAAASDREWIALLDRTYYSRPQFNDAQTDQGQGQVE